MYFREEDHTGYRREDRLVITEHFILNESWSKTLETDTESVLASDSTALTLNRMLCCLQRLEWETMMVGRLESKSDTNFSQIVFADLCREIVNSQISTPLSLPGSFFPQATSSMYFHCGFFSLLLLIGVLFSQSSGGSQR